MRRFMDCLHLRLRAAALIAALAAVLAPGAASAEPAVTPLAPPFALGVSITMTTDPAFIIDANKCSSEGPHAAYVGYRITNTSGSTITNLRATLSGVGNGFVLLSNQNPQFFIGSLASGASRYVYYLLQTPCSDGAVDNLTLTVTNNTDSRALTAPIHAEGANSANAGGAVGGTLLGPGAIVGQTVFMDATYTFGNVDVGDDYNMQPVGNTDFAADCLVLTSNVITASAVPSIAVGTTDQLYFPATVSQGGNSNAVTVRYFFKYMCAGISSTARPYATSLSGNKFKYSGNFDGGGGTGGSPVIPPAGNPFAIAGATTLSVTPTLLSTGGAVTYTLTINNSSAYDATLDSLAVVLPAGVTYGAIAAGSNVTAATSADVPAAGASGRVVFRGIPNTTYYIAPNGSVVLKFTATVPGTAGSYTASGFAYAGATELSGGTATVVVGADVTTTLSGPATGIVGTNITYTMTTTNVGPAGATGVVAKVTLPAGLTFVSGTRAGTVAGGVVSFPSASIASGSSIVDVITVSVTTPGSKLVIASSTATSSDGQPANNNGSLANARVTTNAVALSVTTTSVVTTTVPNLPGSGYSAQFVVRNTSSVSAVFNLAATSNTPGGFLSISAIAGTGVAATGATGSITLNADESVTVTASYAVAQGAIGNENLVLTATSALVPTVTNSAALTIRRVIPQMVVVRSIDTPAPKPGDDVMYTIETQNIGENLAKTVFVRDSIGAPLQFKIASVNNVLLGGLSAAVTYSTNGTTWTYTPASGGCGAPAGYDGCVRWIRWSIAEDVPVTAGVIRAGQFKYLARVR